MKHDESFSPSDYIAKTCRDLPSPRKCPNDVLLKDNAGSIKHMFFPSLNEQNDIIGMLEFVTIADAETRASLLQTCIGNVNAFILDISVIVEELEDETIARQLEDYLFEVCSRLWLLAISCEDCKSALVAEVWAWIDSLCGQITAHLSHFHIQLAVAGLVGIFRSFSVAASKTCLVILEKASHFETLFTTLFTEDKIRLVASAAAIARDTLPAPKNTIEPLNALYLLNALVAGVRDILASSLTLVNFESHTFYDIWEDLSKTCGVSKLIYAQSLSSQQIVDSDLKTDVSFPKIVRLISQKCWEHDWRLYILKYTGVDQEVLGDISTLFVQASVLCSLHLPDLQPVVNKNITSFLTETSTLSVGAVPVDLYLSLVEGLEILSLHSDEGTDNEVGVLSSFLTRPANVFVNTADNRICAILRECVCRSLANILSRSSDMAHRQSILYSFTNEIHKAHQKTISATHTRTDLGRKYQNCIAAVASLTFILNAELTTQVAIPALARRLDDTPTVFDDFLWHNLGNIGLTFDPDIFRHVITFILDYSKRTFSKIAKISHTLARMPGRPVELLDIYLEKLLVLFLEKATPLQRHVDPAIINDLLDIMLVVRVICEQEHYALHILESRDPVLLNLFRDVWFTCVLFVLSPSGTWPKGWLSVLRIFALKTPPLIMERQRRSLEADLGSNSILRSIFPESVTSKIKPWLVAIFPANQLEIRNLSFYSSVYLLTTYHVEILRIKSASIDFMYRYLVDERLHNTEIYTILESVCDEVLKTFVSTTSSKTRNSVCAIEQNTQFLLLYAAHRLERARTFASRWIKTILSDLAPELLWDHKVAYLLMDIVRYLDDRRCGVSVEGYQTGVLSKLFFLDEKEAREASNDFYKTSKDWFDMAIRKSTAETIALAQNYLIEMSNKNTYTHLSQNSDLMVLLSRLSNDAEIASAIIRIPGKHSKYMGEIKGMTFAMQRADPEKADELIFKSISNSLNDDLKSVYGMIDSVSFHQKLNSSLFRASAMIIMSDRTEASLLQLVCFVPLIKFDTVVMEIAVSAWSWIMTSKPTLVNRVLTYLIQCWEIVATHNLGIYGVDAGSINPFLEKMTYGAPQKPTGEKDPSEIHRLWIRFFIDRFKADKLRGADLIQIYAQLFDVATDPKHALRTNWTAREARFELASLGARIAIELEKSNPKRCTYLWTKVFDISLSWFELPPMFGRIRKVELKKLVNFYHLVKDIKFSSFASKNLTTIDNIFMNNAGNNTCRVELSEAQQVLNVLLEHEINRLATWINPLEDQKDGFKVLPPAINEKAIKWPTFVRMVWCINPLVAFQLRTRFLNSADQIDAELIELSKSSQLAGISCPEAVSLIVEHAMTKQVSDESSLRYLLYWVAVPPISAISMLGQTQRVQPWILQYAVRVLEYFPVDQVFFYIPQMVQALRYDSVGYIERFILDAAKSSQLFAHQIIWNMKANAYKDEACEVEDSIKSTLDRVRTKILSDLSGSDKEFYEREFSFFEEVTGISGTLKPLVQADATKAEKKKKIDEEMLKIKVEIGVYLPTNPDSIVVDIDYKSGRPLQSHAKAPFMATFKVKDSENRNYNMLSSTSSPTLSNLALKPANDPDTSDTRWMSSIFKVGDDCRQDVLALQLICLFKNIFISAGLDLYTFPYRVVATAPGCGVIEVIPRSISRDMMGREKVNSLFDWFLAEFGPEDGVEYQKAQREFVKSLAAYSVIMFILQIKDRHNGNIMFDKEGHMVHIDFGFILSIAPGGGILEVSPFKLTTEMVQVMGGDVTSPAYRIFTELCIKAYLACRSYATEIISMVQLMMDSGLPCFKGEITIRKLRERFQLDKTERGASEFMMNCIRQSHENTRSGLYDRFQYLQNGIPY